MSPQMLLALAATAIASGAAAVFVDRTYFQDNVPEHVVTTEGVRTTFRYNRSKGAWETVKTEGLGDGDPVAQPAAA